MLKVCMMMYITFRLVLKTRVSEWADKLREEIRLTYRHRLPLGTHAPRADKILRLHSGIE